MHPALVSVSEPLAHSCNDGHDMTLQDLAGRVAAMKAAAKADAADEEPEPVPQYDALLAEEVR